MERLDILFTSLWLGIIIISIHLFTKLAFDHSDSFTRISLRVVTTDIKPTESILSLILTSTEPSIKKKIRYFPWMDLESIPKVVKVGLHVEHSGNQVIVGLYNWYKE